ncbi:MAG: extracellular solute-binding protein [Planctomycetota bacterium]
MSRQGWPRRLFAAALTLFAMALTGCADESEREREITFWTLSLRPTFTDYMEQSIASFEAAHPDVRVQWVDVPMGAVDRKLIAAAAADRAPDVVNLSDLMFARYAGAGAFLDVERPGGVLDRFHPGALAVGRIDGRQLALPWYLTTQALICNERLLREGGLSADDVGRTWPALLEQAGPFRASTGTWLFSQPIGTDSQLPIMLLAEGLSPLRPGDDGLLEPDLMHPDILGFLQAWVDLYREGGLPREAATDGFEHLIEVYQNGEVALVNTGANFLGRVRDVSRSIYDDTIVLGPVTGSLDAAHVAVMLVCVSARTSHPEDAVALAEHMTSAERQLALARLAPVLPSTSASLDDAFFQGPTPTEIAEGAALIGEARRIVAGELGTAVAFTPALECWPELRRAFEEHFKAVLLDDAELDAEMAACNARWGRIIDAMNRQRRSRGGAAAGIEALPEAIRRGLAEGAIRE